MFQPSNCGKKCLRSRRTAPKLILGKLQTRLRKVPPEILKTPNSPVSLLKLPFGGNTLLLDKTSCSLVPGKPDADGIWRARSWKKSLQTCISHRITPHHITLHLHSIHHYLQHCIVLPFLTIHWVAIRYISITGWWFQPLWKIWKSVGMIIPNIWKNKKCSKPPTRSYWHRSLVDPVASTEKLIVSRVDSSHDTKGRWNHTPNYFTIY